MVKTDDYLLLVEDGSGGASTISTAAAFVEKLVRVKAKTGEESVEMEAMVDGNGGSGEGGGELFGSGIEDFVARHGWLPPRRFLLLFFHQIGIV